LEPRQERRRPGHALVWLACRIRRWRIGVGLDWYDCFQSVAPSGDLFCCVLAGLWPAFFVLAAFIADRASFDLEFLKSVWITAVPAFIGTLAVTYFIPTPWAKRLWPRWLLIVPIGAFVVLGYSLIPLFLR